MAYHQVSNHLTNALTADVRNLLKQFSKRSYRISYHQFTEIIFSDRLAVCPSKIRRKSKRRTLSDHYPGLGGNPSGIGIQYEYDLKTDRVMDLNVTASARNDRYDSVSTIPGIESGSLIIRDLGYHAGATFQSIADNGAFFLSRLHSTAVVYNHDSTAVDFENIYSKMKMMQIDSMELPVYFITEGQKIFVRMILSLVPDEVYKKRLRERDRENKKRGYKSSDKLKILYRFTIFITGAPEEYLPENTVYPVYRLRWQCEPVFKVWKSVFHIDTIHKMKENCYLCLLYTRLILLMINLQIISRVQKEFFIYKKGKVIMIRAPLKTPNFFPSVF
jgi:hypothetical protein